MVHLSPHLPDSAEWDVAKMVLKYFERPWTSDGTGWSTVRRRPQLCVHCKRDPKVKHSATAVESLECRRELTALPVDLFLSCHLPEQRDVSIHVPVALDFATMKLCKPGLSAAGMALFLLSCVTVVDASNAVLGQYIVTWSGAMASVYLRVRDGTVLQQNLSSSSSSPAPTFQFSMTSWNQYTAGPCQVQPSCLLLSYKCQLASTNDSLMAKAASTRPPVFTAVIPKAAWLEQQKQ